MKSHKRIDEQQAYDMWLECLNSAIKSVVSMVLYIVIQRKWHRYNVIALFDDIVETINTPIKVFGKEVDDLYIQDYISEKYPEIDFSRIKVNAASKDESRRRSKEHDRTQQSRKELKAKEPKLINSMDKCCKDCIERHPHCHGSCERYKQYTAANDAKRTARQKREHAERDMYEHVLRNVDMARKKKRGGKKL